MLGSRTFLAAPFHNPDGLAADLACVILAGRGRFAFNGIKVIFTGVAVHVDLLRCCYCCLRDDQRDRRPRRHALQR